MEVLLQTYYILLPIVATSLIGWVGYLLKTQRKKEANIAKIRASNTAGLCMILRYMLRRYHAEYMAHGEISYTQYQDWVDFYDTYKALGGNSVAVEWNEDIENLPKKDCLSDMGMFEKMLKKARESYED